MRRETQYQKKNNDGTIQCLLCPRLCILGEGHVGSCRTRKVINGVLYSISYGNPCAIHVDPIEKKPLYHFYPGSNTYSLGVAGCVLHCKNCQNHTISQSSPAEVPGLTLPPEAIVGECIASGCSTISYTYSDPVAFYEYTQEISRIAHETGLKNVLVTAGYINQDPLRDILQYIHAANVDIKCFSNDTYHQLCGGSLDPVLNALKTINDAGIWLEITNLLVPGLTDDFETIALMCGWLLSNGFENTPLHFTSFTPHYQLKDVPTTPISTIQKAINIARASGIKYVYAGNISNTDDTNTRCHTCHTLLVKREGFNVQVNALFHGTCPQCGGQVAGRF